MSYFTKNGYWKSVKDWHKIASYYESKNIAIPVNSHYPLDQSAICSPFVSKGQIAIRNKRYLSFEQRVNSHGKYIHTMFFAFQCP